MKLIKLDPLNYPITAEIFKPLTSFQPLCAAVIAGLQPGTIFTDHPTDPQMALANVWENWCFLAGTPTEENIAVINTALFERTLLPPSVEFALFTVTEAWEEHLAELFHPRHPVPAKRRHYRAAKITFDWQVNQPPGFEIVQLSPEMLDGYDLPEEVTQTLERWQKISHPAFMDCGFAAVEGRKVVAWATVDGIHAGQGDIGLVTLEGYRRKGLASVTAAAAAEYALSHGAAEIHWTCAENNTPSIHTAEKLGFMFEKKYQAYYFEFDELWDLVQYAGYLVNEAEYKKGLETCTKAQALSASPPPAIWIYAARAQAMLGQKEAALRSLKTLSKSGWQDADLLEKDERFVSLRDTNQWHEILSNMRQTQANNHP